MVLRIITQFFRNDGVAEEEGEVAEDVVARGRDCSGRGQLLLLRHVSGWFVEKEATHKGFLARALFHKL